MQSLKSLESSFQLQSFTRIWKNPSFEELKKLALQQHARPTEFGSISVVPKFKSRSADFTRTSVDKTFMSQDYEVVKNLNDFVKNKELIQLDLCMCPQSETEFHCRLYVEKEFATLAYMAKRSLAPWTQGEHTPDLTVIDIPSWNLGDRRILVDHETWTTFVLGSDYYGEIKKGFLRMTMYKGKLAGGLGLHAGSKRLFARSEKTNEINPFGVLLFGLSGTGKTSLTCHHYGCTSQGEKNEILQDDVVILTSKGRAVGTEGGGFYIKTDALNPEEQPILYKAAIQDDAILENVMVKPDGKVDFYDSTISKNGRAIVTLKHIDCMGPTLHLDKVDACIFITRHEMVPPIARLTPEQGAVAFMLGESIKTSAADPKAKGEPVRCVGTNPFIMGDLGEEGNRMYDLIKKLGIQCYLLNTGFIGPKSKKEKIKIADSTMLLRALARDAITWKKDPILCFEIPDHVFGKPIEERLEMHHAWDEAELKAEYKAVRDDRRAYLETFPKLNKQVLSALY